MAGSPGAMGCPQRQQASNWVGTAPPITELLRLVCAIPPAEPDVQLSPHPALHQMS